MAQYLEAASYSSLAESTKNANIAPTEYTSFRSNVNGNAFVFILGNIFVFVFVFVVVV